MSKDMACASIEQITKPIDLGESPYWDSKRQVLYYVNILAGEVHCYNPATKKHTHAKVGDDTVSFIVPIENQPDKFLISFGGNLEVIMWDSKSHTIKHKEKFIELETAPDVRMNDGKVSPGGVLFIGSMARKLPDKTVPPGRGNLFLIDRRDSSAPKAVKLLKNIGIANGLAWNKDETKFYWADTLAKIVYVFDYDKNNLTLSNQQVLLDYDKENLSGYPDGMTIDTEGALFIASVDGGSEVIKVDSKTGAVLQRIEFPGVSDVSSVIFGGQDYSELYVTTIHRKEESISGSLFKITNLDTKGYPSVPYKL